MHHTEIQRYSRPPIFVSTTSSGLNRYFLANLFLFVLALVFVSLTQAAPGNLAQGRPAVASSQETALLGPANAVDGNTATRWGSLEGVDPQWIYVDLGSVQSINHVVLNWEGAFGMAYQIQVTTDATVTPSTVWSTVFNTTTGNGGVDDLTFTATNARYVRMYGTQRGTVWGYSLFEFEVYAATAPPVLTTLTVSPVTATLPVGNTQTFIATGHDQFGADIATTVSWSVTGGGTINSGGLFTATTLGGPFTVKATATSNSSITGTASVTVADTIPAPPGNLALAKPAVASSQETALLGPGNAVDGNATSRWASVAGIDPQWIYVDIGTVYTINHVVLNWEAAYGKAYQIQVTTDATVTPSTVWTPVFTETNGNGAIDDITFTQINARYVRVQGTQRGTVWGYSLFEFQVFGVSEPPVLTTIDVAPTTASVVNGNAQTFTATGRDQFGAVIATTVNWTVSGGGNISSGGLFTATTVGGPFTVTATATSNSSIKGAATVSVTDGSTAPPGNLALTRPALASSQESATLTPAKAVDGSAGTRWASLAGSDPQWIYVDMGVVYPIDHVVLNWEGAYGKAYQIQVTTDATVTPSTVWNTVFSTTTGNGGTDDITFAAANARYVRVYGTQRGTVWGYSLYEFEIYGVTAGGTPVLTTIGVTPVSASVLVGDTQTFTATGRDQFGAVIATTVNWSVSGGGTINTGGVFSATGAGGPYNVTATATTDSSISGTASVSVTNVQSPPPGDIAQGRPAVGSSQESATYAAGKAVDGNSSTRWASVAGIDPQWIFVDLGAIYPINHVVLTWEAAYGKGYRIEVSNDSTVWTPVFTETNGNGGIDDITFATTNARYVRMYGTARGTVWGYSLWDFKVFGATALPVSYTFSSTDVSAWANVNESGILSTWQVQSGQYQQSTDVGDRSFGTPFIQSYRIGTYSYLPGLIGLSDYRFSVDITPIRDAAARDPFDGQDVGVMFRYLDNNNYYRVAFSARESMARLEKRVGGVFTALATISRGYVEGQPFNLSINVSGNLIQVTRDGDPLFAVRDTALTSGTVALYCQDASRFDNVLIDVSDPNPTLVVSGPLAHSVQTGNTVTASAVVTNKPVGGSVGFEFAGTACGTTTESPAGSGFYTASCGTWARGDYFVPGPGETATGQPLRGLLRNSSNAVVASDENVRIGLQGDQLVSVGDSLTLGTFDFFGRDNTSKDGRILGQQGFQASLGDSLTATRGYPNMVFNEGVGGDKTTDTLTRISSILARYPGSKSALLMLGANDSSTGTALTPAAFQANMQSLVNSINGQSKTVWVAKSLPVLPFAANATRNADLAAYNTAIDSLTAAPGCTGCLKQGPNFFKFFYDDNNTSGTTTDDYERLSMFYDKLHGNALAYSIMATLWNNALTGATTVPFYLDRLCNRLVSATCAAVSPTNHKQNLLPTGYPYYVDQTYTLTSIPAALADGIWIQTANAAAERTNTSTTYIDFTVDVPVKVYVAYDWNGGAATLPGWLSGWIDEGVNVQTTDPLAPTLHVYSKTFAAGPVSLGGNLAAPASGADSNYLAVVVKQ